MLSVASAFISAERVGSIVGSIVGSRVRCLLRNDFAECLRCDTKRLWCGQYFRCGRYHCSGVGSTKGGVVEEELCADQRRSHVTPSGLIQSVAKIFCLPLQPKYGVSSQGIMIRSLLTKIMMVRKPFAKKKTLLTKQ